MHQIESITMTSSLDHNQNTVHFSSHDTENFFAAYRSQAPSLEQKISTLSELVYFFASFHFVEWMQEDNSACLTILAAEKAYNRPLSYSQAEKNGITVKVYADSPSVILESVIKIQNVVVNPEIFNLESVSEAVTAANIQKMKILKSKL
jgi:hypothetical protein